MATESEASKKAFQGSCHCGSVRYEIMLSLPSPPEKLSVVRCNCTFCVKTGYTSFRLPRTDFKLLRPSSVEELKDYGGNSPSLHKYLCNNYGVNISADGTVDFGGQMVDIFSINLGTLDQPQEGLDLAGCKLQYWDGRHDNWSGGPKDSPWSDGLI